MLARRAARRAPLLVAVRALLAALPGVLGFSAAPQTFGALGEQTACVGLARLGNIGQLQACADELLEGEPPCTELQEGRLRKALHSLKEAREACEATEQQVTAWGCKALSDLAHGLFAEASRLLRLCRHDGGLEPDRGASACEENGRAAAVAMYGAWAMTETTHRNTPAHYIVSSKLEALRPEFVGELSMGGGADSEGVPLAWGVAMRFVEKLKYWITGYIWRETHWLWLSDSLQAGRVVQTAWGSAEEWAEKFGANDCHAETPLEEAAPSYLFSDAMGMRWEIFATLLRELWERRGGEDGKLLSVVEVGVFAGHLSHKLLASCDFIRLLGVDPYIGRDGTFPGHFSDTLDPDVAMYKAWQGMEPYGERAQLWPLTSKEAAEDLADGSVDAIFIDGCHLFDCVREDFEVWLPKMRRGVDTLVAGHDFSPQWPGVVRAVHERRSRGREVSLASDWMYWWFEHYD